MPRALIGFDLVSVLAFVAIGRDTHDRAATFGGFIETAAPFLIAVVVGWTAARIWRAPLSLRAGATVAAVTVVVGMAARNLVFGDGTAASFVIVATIFLSGFILGWRLLAGRFVPSGAM